MGTPQALEDLPPSAKLVYTVLENEGHLTQTQLADETMLATRTVRTALDKLKTADLVEERAYPADARKNLYALRKESEPASR